MCHLPFKIHCNRRFFRETGEDCGSGGESGGLGDLEFDSPFIAIAGLTDVLKADKEMLMLDIGTFARCGHYKSILHSLYISCNGSKQCVAVAIFYPQN